MIPPQPPSDGQEHRPPPAPVDKPNDWEDLAGLDRAFLEAVVLTAPAFIVKTTPQGRFLFVNHYGDGGPEVIANRNVVDFVEEEARPRVKQCLEDVVRTGQRSHFECCAFGADVGDAHFNVTVGPVFEGERVAALVLVAQDVTQLKRMAEHQRQTQKMEAVGQLAAGVAHNFNNTLQGIVGNIELAGAHADGNGKTYLQNALAACGDASRLVKDLLLFAGRQSRPGREIVNLEVCVERVLSMCKVTFDRMITLAMLKKSDLPPLAVHTHEIEHAVFNLLLNARDAVAAVTRPEIVVELELLPPGAPEVGSARPPTPCAAIRVRDNGCGMPEDVRSRMFEPFFTTKSAGHGTGLGLATVLACARQHDGWAACESRPGQGAIVSLYLPYPAAKTRERLASPRPPAQPAGPVVLVVDDDEIVRDSVARVLRFGGYQPYTADDGESALEFLARAEPPPKVVLIDESMPGLGGAGVRRHLAAHAPEIKVVIVSGLAADDLDAHGADAILEKPVRADTLLDTVGQVLAEPQRPR